MYRRETNRKYAEEFANAASRCPAEGALKFVHIVRMMQWSDKISDGRTMSDKQAYEAAVKGLALHANKDRGGFTQGELDAMECAKPALLI